MRRPSRAPRRLALAAVGFFALLQCLPLAASALGYLSLTDAVFEEKLARLRHSPYPEPAVRHTLAVGSSRVWGGLDAGTFADESSRLRGRPERAFNFGVSALGPVTQHLYLRRLLDAGVPADAVILEAMPPLFGETPGERLEGRWLGGHRLRGDEFALVSRLGWPIERTCHPVAEWLAPAYAYRAPVVERVAPLLQTRTVMVPTDAGTDALGWGRYHVEDVPPQTYRRMLTMAERTYGPFLNPLKAHDPAWAALAASLDLCHERWAEACVLVTPEGPDFRALYGPGAWDAFRTRLAETVSRHGGRLIDAREWIEAGDFSDGHHLLPRGADRFTRRLAAELGRP